MAAASTQREDGFVLRGFAAWRTPRSRGPCRVAVGALHWLVGSEGIRAHEGFLCLWSPE